MVYTVEVFDQGYIIMYMCSVPGSNVHVFYIFFTFVFV